MPFWFFLLMQKLIKDNLNNIPICIVIPISHENKQ